MVGKEQGVAPTSCGHHVGVSRDWDYPRHSLPSPMPYLFVVEKVGWRDDFNQPWEGTGEDYTGLSPRMERLLLPFPESPLRHKNPELPKPPRQEEKSSLRERSLDPEPRMDRSYVHRLTSRQVLLENTYNFDTETQTHIQYTRFWIRPIHSIATILHSSPRFVRRQWKPASDMPRPKWIDHEKYPLGSVVTYSVKALETEVRHCTYYVNQSVNSEVANALWTWALAVTVCVLLGRLKDKLIVCSLVL
ncbi:hypothetical protein B0H10DRAFT_1292664 [Mycena sp. CBHHK59/15]|nr:hypothetical protein B0H10DRAFT_1292664 [Mycena sp. CBHHK59/15]